MKIDRFLWVLIFFTCTELHGKEAILVPVAYDNNTQKWNILLGGDDYSGWDLFSTKIKNQKEVRKELIEAFNEKTFKAYNLPSSFLSDLDPVFIDDEFEVYIAPVPYIPREDIIVKMKNKITPYTFLDFVWEPVRNILEKPFLRKLQNVALRRAGPFKPTERMMGILQNYWSDAEIKFNEQKAIPVQIKNDSWKGLRKAIYFYDSKNPYYEFTNFANYSVTDAQGHVWPTSENYFQAQKFVDNPHVYAMMKRLKTPREAFDFVRSYQINQNEWKLKSVAVMLDAVRRKFEDHMSLKHMLLNTGDKILVEDAGAKDAFWGAGAYGEGTNLLGQVLMRVRDELLSNVPETEDFIWYKNYQDYRDQKNGNIVRMQGVERTIKPVRVQPKKPLQPAKKVVDREQQLKLLIDKLKRLDDALA